MSLVADFIGRIKAEQLKLADSLTQGFAVNFETYQRLVGRHQGLQEALSILNQLIEEERNVE